jgi:hypothetical protein
MEVRRNPDYVRPHKIMEEPLERNNDKYCAFHEANGHLTEGCIALRLMIERFIRNGKLSVSLWIIEPNPDRTEIDNLGTIYLGTIGTGLYPLRGVKKIGIENMIEEGRNPIGREAGVGA